MTETVKAARFDQTAFRSWLEQPTTTPDGEISKYDAVPDLATGWQRHDGQGGWLATVVLDALAGDAGQTVWTYGPGVSGLKLWATESPEPGADGGVTAEVTFDGVPLSLGHIPADELVATEQDVLPGYEAAELALGVLAERVSRTVEHYLRTTVGDAAPVGELWAGPFGSLTGNEVRLALCGLAELFNGVEPGDFDGPQLAAVNKVVGAWMEGTAVDAEIL
jgi:hypothetical protein